METNEKITPVNTEEIMEEIRNRIKERGYSAEDVLKFADVSVSDVGDYVSSTRFDGRELLNAVNQANATRGMEYDMSFIGGGIGGAIKKVIWILNAFMFYPLIAQINKHNDSVTKSLNQLASYVMGKEKLTDEGNFEDGNLIKTLDDHEKLIEELEAKIARLELKLEQLEAGEKN